MTIGGINYDQKNGLGQVSNNDEVLYFGFVGYMTPDSFLSLAGTLHEPEKDTVEYLTQILKEGEPIASPFLDYDVDEKSIVGHEGRHRCLAIKAFNKSAIVPVHFFLSRGYRGRHVTEEMLKSCNEGIKKENRSTVISNTLKAAFSENTGFIKL